MPRRILLLVTDLEIGGTPTVVRELAIRLHDPPEIVVEVACLKGWGPVADQLRDAGIDATALDVRSVLALPAAVQRLRARISNSNIDTVVSFLIHANAVAAVALKSVPQVRLIESIQTTQPRPRWHWWLQGHVHQRAERLVVPSRAIVEAAVTRSGIPPERFVVIPNALDPSAFSRACVFDGGAVRVGFLGRIDPVKRLGIAVGAVREARNLPAQLHVFGDGRGADAWRETFKRLDPTGQTLHWHGPIPRPQDALSQVDVLVLPSIGEGFGLVLIEAMAAGVPVIASSAGAIPEIIRHGHNGLLVPVSPDEQSGFADAIRQLQSDVTSRERMIANALADVANRFTWNVVLPQYRQLLGL